MISVEAAVAEEAIRHLAAYLPISAMGDHPIIAEAEDLAVEGVLHFPVPSMAAIKEAVEALVVEDLAEEVVPRLLV
jgi:hypothetical protein